MDGSGIDNGVYAGDDVGSPLSIEDPCAQALQTVGQRGFFAVRAGDRKSFF